MEDNLLSPVSESSKDVPVTENEASVPLLPGLHALGFTPPTGFTFAHWQGYMCFVKIEKEAIDWQLGDMLLWADFQGKEVEEAAIQYAYELGWADQTCRNAKSLAKRYPHHTRFGNPLTPSHHNMVRGLPEPERMKLLEQAQAEHWSVSQLKAAKNGCAQNGDISSNSTENSNEFVDLAASAKFSGLTEGQEFYDYGYRDGLRKAMELIEPYKNEFVSIAKAIDLIQAELAKA